MAVGGLGEVTEGHRAEEAERQRAGAALERLVHALLGVVLAQSLNRYSAIVVDPFRATNRVATLGLVVVFYLSLSSWLALSRLVSEVSYTWEYRSGRLRLYLDVSSIVLYAYLLLTLEPLTGPEGGGAWLGPHLAGYPLVFTTYALASWARKAQEKAERHQGRKPPEPVIALAVALLTAVVWVAYLVFAPRVAAVSGSIQWFNVTCLAIVLLVVGGYRHRWFKKRRPQRTVRSAI